MGSDWVAKSMKVKANNSGLKKQAKLQMSQALEEDPTVFQYDEVYDDLEKKKEVEKESKKEVDRKPKYVANLLKAADERQKEFERRIERQVQKEREAEGDKFADKESFVTSAYRKKMEEIAKQEEEEARQARIEAALDVTKQNNLDGFYRHLYRQTMGEEKEQVESRKTKEEKPEETEEEKAARVKKEIQKIKIDEEVPEAETVTEDSSKIIKKIDKKKGFRKKEVVESSSEEESSTEESDDEDEKDNPVKNVALSAEEKFEQRKQELKEQRERREKRKRKIEQDASSSESEDETESKKIKDTEDVKASNSDQDDVVVAEPEDNKPRMNIWEKRTVGDVFESAVRRFWERRANRES